MKFISGIKKETANPEVTIQIPIYHRASVSFFKNSSVYYLYRSYKASNTNNAQFSELILTPIKPDIWHHIRRVTLTAIDSPGIINAITSKLRDLKINVIIEEALTTQINAAHNITLIIDLHTYILHGKNFQANKKVPAHFIEEIKSELSRLINQ